VEGSEEFFFNGCEWGERVGEDDLWGWVSLTLGCKTDEDMFIVMERLLKLYCVNEMA
jgi:hypothetical protein